MTAAVLFAGVFTFIGYYAWCLHLDQQEKERKYVRQQRNRVG